jgi:integrase
VSDSNSTTPKLAGKPIKPCPEFPLFPHAAGVWAKKIRGKLRYFGSWSDPDAALAKYLKEKDALHSGRTPRPDAEALTVKDLSNAFLNAKKALLEAGELSPRTWTEYKRVCELLVAHFGKQRLVADLYPDDFAGLRIESAKKWGPHRLATTIQYIRSVFKFGFDSSLISAPVRFGPGFKGPSKKVLRRHRAQQGPKLFLREEVRRLIEAAAVPFRAMLLLGISCGFGNSDCAGLPLLALDLESGVVDFPRPKTGIGRRCPLWPETVAAIRAALDKRPTPKSQAHAELTFVTKYGDSWGTHPSAITHEMRKLMEKVGISGHRNFYTLRHTFRTVADAAKDQPAADHIMGHESPHISSHYRESIGDDRLKAVTDHVRVWLFQENATQTRDELAPIAEENRPQGGEP